MKKRSPLVVAAVVAATLALVVLVAGFTLRFLGAKQRVDGFAALSAAKLPVLPEDLAPPADTRPEPTPWLAELVAARARWRPDELATKASFDAWRARARAGDLGAAAEEAFARLEACAGADASVAIQRAIDVIAAHDGVVAPPPCGAEAARLLAIGVAPLVEVARRAAAFGPVDPRVVLAHLDSGGGAFATLPVPQSVDAGAALEVELLARLWSERPEGAVEILHAQRDVVRVFAGAPLLVGFVAAAAGEQRFLGMLELALSRQPRDTDLRAIEDEIAKLQPRARLAVAAAGECAFGNRAFERMRRGTPVTGLGESALPTSLTASFDQAAHMRAWRERIDRLGAPAHRRAPPTRITWIDRQLAPVTSSLAAAPESAIAMADLLEARLGLAALALAAFRSGAQELLQLAAATTDPFDGRPLRVGFGDGGLVLLWSVGPDGADDGGIDDERDVVWRFKPR